MNRDQLPDLLKKHNACPDATEWVRAADKQTASEIWESCERGDWMLWICARLKIDRKLLVSAACLCARQSLVHVRPGEDRPRIAIETAERWVRGEATIKEVLDARRAAYDAAAAYDARRKSLAESARLVRTVIAWDALEARAREP